MQCDISRMTPIEDIGETRGPKPSAGKLMIAAAQSFYGVVNANPRLQIPPAIRQPRQSRRPIPLRSIALRFFALPRPYHRVIALMAQDAKPVTECPAITGDSWVRELMPSFGKMRYR